MVCTLPLAYRALAVAAISMVPSAVYPEIHDCRDPLLRVQAQSASVADLACDAAIEAGTLLHNCGLVQQEPIVIEVVPRAEHPSFGVCMGVFDLETGCLQVTAMEGLASLLPPDDARSLLPAEAVFAAVIAHEMAHALVQQSAAGVEVAATEQEFIASAIEMESLDPAHRAILLEADPVNANGSLSLVHLGVYALAPRSFANNAWMVFSQEPMGCSLVQSIIAGRFRFPRH